MPAPTEQEVVGQHLDIQPAGFDHRLDLVAEAVRRRVVLELGLDLGEEFAPGAGRPRPSSRRPLALELGAALAAEGGGRHDRLHVGAGRARGSSWRWRPAAAIDLPPGRMLPENAAFSDFCRVWYLEMLTEEIENSTMNSAISSVIMSA